MNCDLKGINIVRIVFEIYIVFNKKAKTGRQSQGAFCEIAMRLDYLWCEPETRTKESYRACVCVSLISFSNVFRLMNNLPDLVHCLIFGYLTAFERISKASTVCRRWHSLIKSSSQVWKCCRLCLAKENNLRSVGHRRVPGIDKSTA